MAKDIWAGVDFGNSIINPGSVAQTYNPATGQTTYGTGGANATAFNAIAASSAANSAKGINAPAVATPAGTPAGAPVYQGGALGYAPSSPNTNFSEVPGSNGVGVQSPYAANPNAFPTIKASTPNAENNPTPKDDVTRNQFGQTMAEANDPANWLNGVYAPPLTKEDGSKITNADPAYKDYARQAGLNISRADPLYIGPTKWAELQKQYTPYQLEKAVTRTKDGIFWNPEVNIAKVPSKAPDKVINDFFKDVAAAVDKGKEKTDITKPKDDTSTGDVNAVDVNSKDMDTAIGIFNSIMNTPGMQDLKDDVSEAKKKVEEYDQQMDELTDDIRKEVEGEAPESYINALAAVRGTQIMRLRRQAERDYNEAVSNFNYEKELKTSQINMLVNDSNNRYNRAFQSLQFQEQKAQNAKSWETAKLNAKLSLPAGTSYTFSDGSVVEGIKENDNLATGTYTDANRNVYYYAIDKRTGKEAFPQVFIGKAPAPTSGGSYSISDQFNDYKASEAMNQMKEINAGLAAGTLAKGFDQSGDPFYYDSKAYSDAVAAFNAEVESRKHDWIPNNKLVPGSDEYKALEPSPYDYQKY